MSDTKGTANAQQDLFLEYLFNDPECIGRNAHNIAAQKAGYVGEGAGYRLARELKDEILKRSEEQLAFQAAQASNGLIDMMYEDGTTPKGELRLKAMESLLDRIGVAKKQDIGVTVDAESPIFFLPSKGE